ncbi:MAG: hypothetical protein EOO01_28045, partial [Chitinophagaceae bacterium]
MKPLPTFLGLLLVIPLASIRQMTNNDRLEKTAGVSVLKYFITPAPAPKYFKPSLRLFMPPQDGKTCLPSIMSYINKELCNGRRAPKFYIDMYEDAYPGVDVAQDGIIGSRQTLMDYIASAFHTKSYPASGGIVASINAGNPMLTTIPYYDNAGAEQIHNILIVGYDSSMLDNPKVYYMDSRYGRIFNDINVAAFNSSSPAYI